MLDEYPSLAGAAGSLQIQAGTCEVVVLYVLARHREFEAALGRELVLQRVFVVRGRKVQLLLLELDLVAVAYPRVGFLDLEAVVVRALHAENSCQARMVMKMAMVMITAMVTMPIVMSL